jgi:predicted HTH transcriptional regulator
VRETATLEYKAEMYGRAQADVKEMVRDVVSLANAEGGIVIIGMAEDEEGSAKAIQPIADAEIQADRLVSSCLSNVSERISGLRAVPIPVASGAIIVVHVPRSYRRPHMVTYDGANDFWKRHDRQKSRMSIGEVRTAVTMTEDLESKAERLLESRRRDWLDRKQFLLLLTAPR